MMIEIRVYKLYDTDLVALVDNGYPVPKMMRDALISYANGESLLYYMDEHLYFDMNRKANARLRFEIPDSEEKAIHLIKNIKHGYRNSFCKMLLRNCLTQQNLAGYFADKDLLNLQITDEKNRQGENCQVIPISSVKHKKGRIDIPQISYTPPKLQTNGVEAVQKPQENKTKSKKNNKQDRDEIMATFDSMF